MHRRTPSERSMKRSSTNSCRRVPTFHISQSSCRGDHRKGEGKGRHGEELRIIRAAPASSGISTNTGSRVRRERRPRRHDPPATDYLGERQDLTRQEAERGIRHRPLPEPPGRGAGRPGDARHHRRPGSDVPREGAGPRRNAAQARHPHPLRRLHPRHARLDPEPGGGRRQVDLGLPGQPGPGAALHQRPADPQRSRDRNPHGGHGRHLDHGATHGRGHRRGRKAPGPAGERVGGHRRLRRAGPQQPRGPLLPLRHSQRPRLRHPPRGGRGVRREHVREARARRGSRGGTPAGGDRRRPGGHQRSDPERPRAGDRGRLAGARRLRLSRGLRRLLDGSRLRRGGQAGHRRPRAVRLLPAAGLLPEHPPAAGRPRPDRGGAEARTRARGRAHHRHQPRIALEDMATAILVYRRAVEMGIGTPLPL